MGLNHFLIIFHNNPNKTFKPGDTITGRLIIDLNSVKRINAVRVQFKGRTKTKWSQTQGKSARNYSGKEIYFNVSKIMAQEENGPLELSAGKHNYEFTFALPASLPSSFLTSKGTIKYSVTGIMDRPWKFDHTAKSEFFITQPLDLNRIDFVKTPATLTMEREFCCCFKMGKITTKIKIPCSGFTCGQTVPLIIEVDNVSNKPVEGLHIVLKKYHIYYTTNKGNKKVKSESLFRQDNIRLRVAKNTSNTYFHNILIPTVPIYNLYNCSIINIAYKLKFKLILSEFHSNVPGELPVILGHIPLNYITPIEELSSAATTTEPQN